MSAALEIITGGSQPKRRVGEGKVRSVFQAARKGSKLLVLETLRDRVARDIQSPDTPPRDIASLSKRLMEIMDEIEVLRAKEVQEAKQVSGGVDDEQWEGV